MFKITLCLCVLLCVIGCAVPQDTKVQTEPSPSAESFTVQLTEYKLSEPVDTSKSSVDILEMLTSKVDDQAFEVVETIRFSTLTGSQSVVQYGRRVNVTVGSATTGRGGVVRNMQSLDVGTVVQVSSKSDNGKVILDLSYESSKIDGDVDTELSPNINQTQINTTQLFEFGKPKLVASSSTNATSVLVVTVMQD